jgi:hypothetical protein
MDSVSETSNRNDNVTYITIKKLLSKCRRQLGSDYIVSNESGCFDGLNLIMSQSGRIPEDEVELLTLAPKKSLPRADAYSALTTLLLIIAEGAVGVMAATTESMESWTPSV